MADTRDAPRILVVDDGQEMAEMIADDLSDRGYTAIALTSGREALRCLREERVDALVTDLRMPEIDGLQLLRVSRALDPTRPVIMMTAHGTLDTALEANGDGAFHYLRKPFRLDALVRVLDRALKRG